MSEADVLTPEAMIAAIQAAAKAAHLSPQDICASGLLDLRPETWARWLDAASGGRPLPAFQRKSLVALRRTWDALCGGAR